MKKILSLLLLLALLAVLLPRLESFLRSPDTTPPPVAATATPAGASPLPYASAVPTAAPSAVPAPEEGKTGYQALISAAELKARLLSEPNYPLENVQLEISRDGCITVDASLSLDKTSELPAPLKRLAALRLIRSGMPLHVKGRLSASDAGVTFAAEEAAVGNVSVTRIEQALGLHILTGPPGQTKADQLLNSLLHTQDRRITAVECFNGFVRLTGEE